VVEHGTVLKVSDGDTFRVRLTGGRVLTVRLLGIDAPESYERRFGYSEYGGREAAALLQRLLAGKTVRLESPRNRKGRPQADRYGRRLAWVWQGETDICRTLLTAGWAKVYRKTACPRQAEFLAVEERARDAALGIWDLAKARAFYRTQFRRTGNRLLLPWFWEHDKDFIKEELERQR
jgi:endonuclease YncB( thermonuclease family)